jgi:parallel beta-helix repeat protein
MKLSQPPHVGRYFFLALLFLGLALLAAWAVGVEESEGATLYVDDDAGEGGNGSLEKPFQNIQDAVNASVDGDTVRVWEGLYLLEESLTLNKTINLTGNNSQTTIIKGNGIDIEAERVSVTGFNITGYAAEAVQVQSWANYSRITDNTIVFNGVGIRGSAHHLIIQNNNISHNSNDGIYLRYTTNATVSDNYLYMNKASGIYFEGSYSTFSNNSCFSNRYGLKISDSSFHNMIANNTCRLNTVGILVISYEQHDGNNTIVDNTCVKNYNGLVLNTAHRNLVFNNSFYHNTKGITLRDSSNNSILNNVVSENVQGMKFTFVLTDEYSETRTVNNTIQNNQIVDNTEYGIQVDNQGVVVNASKNYWGSNSGPYNRKGNPQGKGNHVSNDVDFRPWIDKNGTVNHSSETYPEEEVVRFWEKEHVHFLLLFLIIIFLFLGLMIISEPFRYALLSFYTRLNPDKRGSDTEQEKNKGNIYQFVENSPGANLSTVKEEMKLGYGTVVYHLEVLQRERYLRSAVAGLKKQFWTKRDFPSSDEPFLSETQQKIVETLQKAGSLSRAQLCEKTGLPRSTLGFNLAKLVELGKVEEEMRGKEKFCSLKLY